MSEPILPSEEEAMELLLTPDTLVWRRLGDIRMYFGAGSALMLQVAHPTVGSGVRDHSTFQEDPWGRLLRTMDYLYLLTYGGEEAIAMGRRLRNVHKAIKGENADGSRYHALEPEAYAWVHATLIEGAINVHLRFIGPLTAAQIEQLYGEYRPLGRLLGVRDRDLPETWAGFCDYFQEMIDTRLERTESVETVLAALAKPAPPDVGVPGLERLWPLLAIAPAEAVKVSTAGLLSPSARAKLGIEWTPRQEVEFRAMGRASRALSPVLPKSLRNIGPEYLRRRRAEIAKGPLGAGADEADGRTVRESRTTAAAVESATAPTAAG